MPYCRVPLCSVSSGMPCSVLGFSALLNNAFLPCEYTKQTAGSGSREPATTHGRTPQTTRHATTHSKRQEKESTPGFARHFSQYRAGTFGFRASGRYRVFDAATRFSRGFPLLAPITLEVKSEIFCDHTLLSTSDRSGKPTGIPREFTRKETTHPRRVDGGRQSGAYYLAGSAENQ